MLHIYIYIYIYILYTHIARPPRGGGTGGRRVERRRSPRLSTPVPDEYRLQCRSLWLGKKRPPSLARDPWTGQVGSFGILLDAGHGICRWAIPVPGRYHSLLQTHCPAASPNAIRSHPFAWYQQQPEVPQAPRRRRSAQGCRSGIWRGGWADMCLCVCVYVCTYVRTYVRTYVGM